MVAVVDYGAVTCPKCGGRHQRRTYGYNELVRARVAEEGVAGDFVGPAPGYMEWGHFKRKESQRNTRCRGSWPSFAAYLRNLASKILPGGKGSEPFVSSVSYDDRGSRDAQCEAIYFVPLDCDSAGLPDQLIGWLQSVGLAATVNSSRSRKAEKWHVRIPLANPIRFAKGSTLERDRYKHEYKHFLSVMSALAGFGGVGGNCGFDLATDRLTQLLYVPMRANEQQPPAEVRLIEGGGLDWDAFMRATGFDYEASIAADSKSRPSGKRVIRGGNRQAPKNGSTANFGPLGKALLAAGYIGNQKDAHGWHCDCTHPEVHSTGDPKGYSIYFPDTDTLWCASSGHKGTGFHKDRAAQVARLPKHAQDIYWSYMDREFTPFQRERRSSEVPAIRAWLDEQIKLNPSMARKKIVESLIGAVLTLDFSEKFAKQVALEGMRQDEARDFVGRAVYRRRKKKPLRGIGWLKQLGLQAMLDLSTAISLDTDTTSRFDLSKRLGGFKLSRGDEADWRRDVASSLDEADDVLTRFIRRPTYCRTFADVIVGDGEVLGERTLACETLGCVHCWHARTISEVEILAGVWAEERVFYVHKVVLPDDQALDEAESILRRDLNFPRLKLVGRHKDGRPMLVFMTRDFQSNSNLSVALKALKRLTFPTAELERATYDGLGAALACVYYTRMSNAAWHEHLVRKRDREGLVAFTEFWRPKRESGARGSRNSYTRSSKALYFPSREVVRQHNKLKAGDEGAIDLEEYFKVEYVLKHTQYDLKLSVQDYPHQLDRAVQLSKVSYKFQRCEEMFNRIPDAAQVALMEEEAERQQLVAQRE